MLNQEVYDKGVAEFAAKFGGKPEVVAYAPGRIEVLGNHTDYNEGYVFSAAIDKGRSSRSRPRPTTRLRSSPSTWARPTRPRSAR